MGTTTFGCGLLGLIPRLKLRGNRKPKLDERLYELADKIIKEKYMNATQRSKTAAFGFLKIECERQGLLPPSFPWFIGRIEKIDRYELVNSRSGRKAAYKYSIQIHGRPNPNHGDRPWETALIDHTELDIETRCEATELNLGRPWISKLQDAFSRRILAFVLAYDAPSYRTLMLLVQKCLRAHGRLPSLLIVDGGKEFGSNYFQTLMARCESTLIVRPPAQSRFGSLIERVFGTTTTQLVHNLSGNTKATKLVRQLTKEVDPQSHAVWSLPELTDLLSTYYRDHYDCKPHPGLDMMTPAAKYAQGMERAGAREHRIIPFTEDVYILTLPTTRSGHARVQAGHGVIINRIAYWSDAMKDPETEGEDLDVRFDPLDVSVAYARVKGRWQKCISAYAAVLQGRTQKEIEIASKIICRRAAVAGKSLSISAMHLAKLLASAEVHEELRLQQLQDSAMKKALRTATIVTGMERNLVGGDKQNAGNDDTSKTGETRIAPAATEMYPDF